MAAMATSNWAYAVPLDETNGFVQPQRTDVVKPQNTPRASSQHPPRSVSAQRKVDDWDIRSDSGAIESRRISARQSNVPTAGRKRSRNALRDKANMQTNVTTPSSGRKDDSAWIHRDKLAQIEIQEMAEAGFHIRPSRRSTSAGPALDLGEELSRSQSRNESRRPRSRQRESQDAELASAAPQLDEHTGQQYASFDDYANKKRVSTIPAADEDQQGFDQAAQDEYRSYEEFPGDDSYRQHMVRPSTSRIPVSKAGAVPVPQQVVDRDAPLPRSRSGSGAWGSNYDETQYERRARSNSIGSQNLLDNTQGHATPPPGAKESPPKEYNSPPKSRIRARGTPTSGARKTSENGLGNGLGTSNSSEYGGGERGPFSSQKKMQTAKPPGSSGGPRAPEGEPPWLSNMYKPDPRLPPDQQMLPTHARRLMQEQWEKEGKTGTAYDRSLNLLNDNEIPIRSTPSPQPPTEEAALYELEAPAEDHLSPVPSPGLPSSVRSLTRMSDTSQRPSTSGGYKITPTINSPATFEHRAMTPVKDVAAPALVMEPHKPTPRVPDLDEKHEAVPKKGCCCVMM